MSVSSHGLTAAYEGGHIIILSKTVKVMLPNIAINYAVFLKNSTCNILPIQSHKS